MIEAPNKYSTTSTRKNGCRKELQKKGKRKIRGADSEIYRVQIKHLYIREKSRETPSISWKIKEHALLCLFFV